MAYCIMCDNTGVYLEPNDSEKYDEAFENYDRMAIFNLDETRRKALDDVGYTKVTPCPYCHKSPKDYK